MTDSSEEARWALIDRWAAGLFVGKEPELQQALEDARAAGLPPIQVSATQGRFLQILARAVGAHRILEIGTLGGYSGSWLARALPSDGQLVTLELDPGHAAIARRTFARLGMASKVDLRVGPAADSLGRLVEERGPRFDLVFIDADKPSYPAYLEWALRLTRCGSLIVADNVVRNGEVADSTSQDPRVVGVRRYLEISARDPRITGTVIQTVGEKGYDGFSIAVVGGSVDETSSSK